MRYEVASKHRRGFLHSYLVVPADNPDDACAALYDTLDMENRRITRIRRCDESEIKDLDMQRDLNWMTTAIVVVSLLGFALVCYMGTRQ